MLAGYAILFQWTPYCILEYTDDGHELHLQYNYLSHFLLITYLLPVIRQSAGRRVPLDTISSGEHLELEDSRIVIVANKAVDSGNLNLKNMQGKNQYNASKFYANSQFYLVSLSATRDNGKVGNMRVCSYYLF